MPHIIPLRIPCLTTNKIKLKSMVIINQSLILPYATLLQYRRLINNGLTGIMPILNFAILSLNIVNSNGNQIIINIRVHLRLSLA